MIKKQDNEIETIIITRKLNIIPIKSENNTCIKKVYKFHIDKINKKIEALVECESKEKDKKKKEKITDLINDEKNKLEYFLNGEELTRPMVNDYTYTLVRDAMESEARRKNYILSYAFAKMTEARVDLMDIKERNKFIGQLLNPAYRAKGSKKGSIFDETEIDNILGGYGTGFSQELTSKIKDCVKDGLLDGKVSLPSYKLDSPFTIVKDHMGFTHGYDSYEELCEHINDKNCELYFNYGRHHEPTIAKFRINVGHKGNREELLTTLRRLYSGEYQHCGSSIQFDKTGRKIILNLSMKIPKIHMELDENTVVGVDLGIAIPAMCALNNNMYKREAIGSAEDFLRIRTKIQKQRRHVQTSIKNAKGGHGRKKKLKALTRYRQYEKHFVETYNHMVSSRVVKFALSNRAKYINIENLTGYDTSKFILRNWSFYQLQQYITYKAAKYGIEVRKVNPCYTSQVCSVCGNWEEGQRVTQSKFECGNKDCKSHDFKHGFNADFNAARNIAKSTLFMKDGQVTEKSKAEARKYYSIPENIEENKED